MPAAAASQPRSASPILAAGAYEMARSGVFFASDNTRPPEMAPDRKVSEQDCSKPLDYTLGNIRCK